jgi:hypothetical protein
LRYAAFLGYQNNHPEEGPVREPEEAFRLNRYLMTRLVRYRAFGLLTTSAAAGACFRASWSGSSVVGAILLASSAAMLFLVDINLDGLWRSIATTYIDQTKIHAEGAPIMRRGRVSDYL